MSQMRGRTRKTRPALDTATVVLPATHDPEVARFLRPQPYPEPARVLALTRVGELAHQLLGHRIITSHGAR